MLALIVGAALLAPSLFHNDHSAVVGAAGIDRQDPAAGARWPEGSTGRQLEFDRQPDRADVSFTTAGRADEYALHAGPIACVHRLKLPDTSDAADGFSSLPVRDLDPPDAQLQIARVGSAVRDHHGEMPIDVGGKGMRPMRTLGDRMHDAPRVERTMQRAGLVDEALGARNDPRNASYGYSDSRDHLQKAHRSWSVTQTILGSLIVLASIVLAVCLIALLVTLFEFISRPEERVWPVRIARTAVVANLVLAFAFAALVRVE